MFEIMDCELWNRFNYGCRGQIALLAYGVNFYVVIDEFASIFIYIFKF